MRKEFSPFFLGFHSEAIIGRCAQAVTQLLLIKLHCAWNSVFALVGQNDRTWLDLREPGRLTSVNCPSLQEPQHWAARAVLPYWRHAVAHWESRSRLSVSGHRGANWNVKISWEWERTDEFPELLFKQKDLQVCFMGRTVLKTPIWKWNMTLLCQQHEANRSSDLVWTFVENYSQF